ncbi:hypothetical protein D3Z48_20750 [Clostridiaceae bacterium]|nr:hypothetical protein [Clostridiaceae bacterium]
MRKKTRLAAVPFTVILIVIGGDASGFHKISIKIAQKAIGGIRWFFVRNFQKGELMKHKLKRLLSSVLAAATMFSSFAGVIPKAAAFSGGDSITLVYENDKQSYLREQKGGSWVNLPIHECI